MLEEEEQQQQEQQQQEQEEQEEQEQEDDDGEGEEEEEKEEYVIKRWRGILTIIFTRVLEKFLLISRAVWRGKIWNNLSLVVL